MGNSTMFGWKWRIWYKLMVLCLSKNIQEDTGIETNVRIYTLHSFAHHEFAKTNGTSGAMDTARVCFLSVTLSLGKSQVYNTIM